MSNFFYLLLLSSCNFYFALSDRMDRYRTNVKFFVFSKSYPNGTLTHTYDTLESLHCSSEGNTTFVVHGWLESIERPWAKPMINEFLKLRGNCVFFMDYSHYSVHSYGALTPHFNSLADLLAEKILRVAVPANLLMFGFSFGARLATKAGGIVTRSGSVVDKIYACDPAGPGFDPLYKLDPINSAKFVQCIHTSNTYGTKAYNCHQDWRMGFCGVRQAGAKPFPYGSHGLCPYFFLASFTEDFFQSNTHRCRSNRYAQNLPIDYIMGPRESRIHYIGDIFAPTARNPPWSGNGEAFAFKKPDIDFLEDDSFGEEYYNELIK